MSRTDRPVWQMGLEWLLSRRNEQKTVKLERLESVRGSEQMPYVRWVESAAEDAKAHG